MRRLATLNAIAFFVAVFSVVACQDKQAAPAPEPATEEADPAEIAIGERLFMETRFAQFFANAIGKNGDVNRAIASGDAVMKTTAVAGGTTLPGPFLGESMNCAACHLVDQQLDTKGMRAYNDFARLSPIPDRGDGNTTTPRNPPTLVNISQPTGSPEAFHFDGEFSSLQALVGGTLTGRNYGWLADEQRAAVAHIARVIRNDDGSGELAKEFGGSYRDILSGSSNVAAEFALPTEFLVKIDDASDAELVGAVSKLIAAYTADLAFERTSPYDAFLTENGLPVEPGEGETAIAYSRRLLVEINKLASPSFITASNENAFEFHDQPFAFGKAELKGLKIFMSEPANKRSESNVEANGIGNCIGCHAAPNFTDGGLHNTGVSQIGYDAVHGDNMFAQLAIPSLAERNANPKKYLPVHANQLDAEQPFRRIASADNPLHTDLGAWNIFANSNFPHTQDALTALLQAINPETTAATEELLREAIGTFKTPTVRDLGHSAPYMHDGRFDSIEQVVQFYRDVSDLARANKLRNADPLLSHVQLSANDVAAVSAFLRSLNEDYN